MGGTGTSRFTVGRWRPAVPDSAQLPFDKLAALRGAGGRAV